MSHHGSFSERKAFFQRMRGRGKGSAKYAAQLAEAELKADGVLVVGWEPDECEPDCAMLVVWREEDVQWELYMFSVRKGAHCVATMGGVERDADRDYVRFLAAEVLIEAFGALDAAEQVKADELAGRATYAGPVAP